MGAYLAKKYLHNTETASDYAGQMADAFCETKDIGDRWNSYEVADWDAIVNEANKIIEEGKKLLNLGNADAAATIVMEFIRQLCDNFDKNEIDPSPLFGNEKDESFKSSIGQIYQTFGGVDLYPSVEEKAAMLLYLVTKKHSFSDGNKRIAATLFMCL